MRKPKTQSIMRPAALLLFLTMCFIYLYVLVGLPMKGSIPLPFIVVGMISCVILMFKDTVRIRQATDKDRSN